MTDNATMQPPMRKYGINVMFMTAHPLSKDQMTTFKQAGDKFTDTKMPGMNFYRWKGWLPATDAIQAATETEHMVESVTQEVVDITRIEITDVTDEGSFF